MAPKAKGRDLRSGDVARRTREVTKNRPHRDDQMPALL